MDELKLLDDIAKAAKEAGEAILDIVARGFEVETQHRQLVAQSITERVGDPRALGTDLAHGATSCAVVGLTIAGADEAADQPRRWRRPPAIGSLACLAFHCRAGGCCDRGWGSARPERR